MLIRRIELKNFRYVSKETLNVPINKTFILLGKNGSSKSTFFWAVPFCFYGFSDWNLSNTLKWGEKEGYVKIYFEIRGDKYIAERSFDKTSSSFSLYQVINDKIKDIGGGLNKQAEETFKKIFPVPQEVFLQIVTRVQTDNEKYQLGYFCGATPAKMYETIKHFVEVVKIEKYEKANSEVLSDLKEEKIRIESAIESSEQALENLEIQDYTEEEIKQKEERVNELKQQLEEIRQELDVAKEYHAQKKEYDEAQEIIKKYPDIEEYKDEWNEVKSAKEPEVPYDEEKINEINKQIEANQEELRENSEDVEEMQEKVKDFETEQANQRKLLDDLKEQQFEYEKKAGEIKKQIKLLEKGKCPECQRRFRSTDDRIEEYQEKLESLEGPFTDEIEEVRSELKEIRTEISETRNEIENANDWMNELRENISNLKEKRTKAESSKEATEKWNKKQSFREEYPYDENPEKLAYKVQQAKEKEEPEGPEPDSPEFFKRKYDNKMEKYHSERSSLEKIKDTKKHFEYHTEVIEDLTDKLNDVKNDVEKHSKLAKVYSRTGAPHFMISEYLQYLKYYANKYLDKFTDGRISVDFKTDHTSKSKPIELIFYDADRNNAPRPFSTFSRGEKTRVALSVEFLGMGRVFSHLVGVEVKSGLIDEVYGLDEDGQREFAEILKELSGARPVMGGIVCFESMAYNFENIIKVEDGKLIQ